MTNNVHNKSGGALKGRSIATLGDLYLFVGESELPPGKKDPIRSAIKRADELVGHGALDLPANPEFLLGRLDDFSPAMAGMSRGAFANMKSRLRAAFHLASPNLATSRSRPALTGAWRALQHALDVGPRRRLSRLFHFAAAQGWSPSEIDDACLSRFALHLREAAMVATWDGIIRGSIKEWNRLALSNPGSGLVHLTPPTPRRTSYWIGVEHWPASLRGDLEELLAELANPNLFKGRKVRKLKPATVKQYRHMTVTLVSAIVGAGIPLASLQSLAAALHPDHVATALGYLADRGGGTITPIMMQMMVRVQVMSGMVELPDEQRAELNAIHDNMRANLPPERRPRRMAAKNRTLLERLEHDERFADLVQCLPQLLARDARAIADRGGRAPPLMRSAVAIDLLLSCSMRRENLVSLELGKSIKRVGKPPDHAWVIEITEAEVKNGQPLRYRLEGEAAKLLDEYVTQWRERLSKVPNPWLFPAPGGERIDPKTMGAAIATHSKRVLGVRITPHQFRHISAETFLLQHPDKLHLMSEHLGHRDSNTTRHYYARPKQKQASRIYQEHTLKARSEAERRLVAKRRPRRARKGDAQ